MPLDVLALEGLLFLLGAYALDKDKPTVPSEGASGLTDLDLWQRIQDGGDVLGGMMFSAAVTTDPRRIDALIQQRLLHTFYAALGLDHEVLDSDSGLMKHYLQDAYLLQLSQVRAQGGGQVTAQGIAGLTRVSLGEAHDLLTKVLWPMADSGKRPKAERAQAAIVKNIEDIHQAFREVGAIAARAADVSDRDRQAWTEVEALLDSIWDILAQRVAVVMATPPGADGEEFGLFGGLKVSATARSADVISVDPSTGYIDHNGRAMLATQTEFGPVVRYQISLPDGPCSCWVWPGPDGRFPTKVIGTPRGPEYYYGEEGPVSGSVRAINAILDSGGTSSATVPSWGMGWVVMVEGPGLSSSNHIFHPDAVPGVVMGLPGFPKALGEILAGRREGRFGAMPHAFSDGTFKRDAVAYIKTGLGMSEGNTRGMRVDVSEFSHTGRPAFSMMIRSVSRTGSDADLACSAAPPEPWIVVRRQVAELARSRGVTGIMVPQRGMDAVDIIFIDRPLVLEWSEKDYIVWQPSVRYGEGGYDFVDLGEVVQRSMLGQSGWGQGEAYEAFLFPGTRAVDPEAHQRWRERGGRGFGLVPSEAPITVRPGLLPTPSRSASALPAQERDSYRFVTVLDDGRWRVSELLSKPALLQVGQDLDLGLSTWWSRFFGRHARPFLLADLTGVGRHALFFVLQDGRTSWLDMAWQRSMAQVQQDQIQAFGPVLVALKGQRSPALVQISSPILPEVTRGF